MSHRFAEIVSQDTGCPILFEVIPPRRDTDDEKVMAWRDRVIEGISDRPILALNVPEIRDEVREGERTYTYVKRMKPREFGKRLLEAHPGPIELVINRVVVYRPIEQQREWLDNSHRDWGIRNVILVGGELEPDAYPGPTVSGMAELISRHVNPALPSQERWFCGGIAIPTRRSPDPAMDEPFRLLQKGRSGIDFFSTQIIYESDNIRRLLADYSDLCRKEGVAPKRLFLSFAPVQTKKHIEFLRWLGVTITPGIEGELLRNSDKVGLQSIAICRRILAKVIEFNSRLDPIIPLGLNLSPLIRSNFDLGVELTDALAEVIR